MVNTGSSPTITHCTFSNNIASRGGGMDNESDSNPTITDCTFNHNQAVSGGGMANIGSSPTITNCTFSSNNGTSLGAGMYNASDSSPAITNCTFNNGLTDEGGGNIQLRVQSQCVELHLQ